MNVPTKVQMRPAQVVALLVISCLACSNSIEGQQTSPPGVQGSLLVQKAYAQMAGPISLNDVVITGGARRIAGSDDESGTASLKALATGETRIEFNFPSGQRSETRNNSEAGPRGQWT